MTKKEIGTTCMKFRDAAKITKYSISNLSKKSATGLNYHTIEKIEEGKENYTVDNLLAYLAAINRKLSVE